MPAFDLDILTSNKEDVFLSFQDNGHPSTTMIVQPGAPVASAFGLSDVTGDSQARIDSEMEVNNKCEKAPEDQQNEEAEDFAVSAGESDEDESEDEDDMEEDGDDVLDSEVETDEEDVDVE